MLPPHELRGKEFTHTIRGYNITEVDEHIQFILEKYTELYRENDRLENELKKSQARLSELEKNSDAIRRAMVNAQREEHKIVTEAEERADLIMRTAKNNCDRVLKDFRTKIREERLTLHRLRETVAEFRENSLKQYQISMKYIEQLAPEREGEPEWEMTEEEYAAQLLEQMKLDIADSVNNSYTEEAIPEDDGVPKGIPGGDEEKLNTAPVRSRSASRRPKRSGNASTLTPADEAQLDKTLEELLAAELPQPDGATAEIDFTTRETKIFDKI